MGLNFICVCSCNIPQRLSSESIFLIVTEVGNLVWKGWEAERPQQPLSALPGCQMPRLSQYCQHNIKSLWFCISNLSFHIDFFKNHPDNILRLHIRANHHLGTVGFVLAGPFKKVKQRLVNGIKHRKNCKCCPRHSLFKGHNVIVIYCCSQLSEM